MDKNSPGIKPLVTAPTFDVDDLNYEQIVALHHEHLYRFAYSLAGNPDDSAELTQETYVRLLTNGRQLRDRAKVKSWLFTTLYRIYLGWRRHETRFPHLEIESVAHELPTLSPGMVDVMDGETVMERLLEIEERYRTPLTLFYLQGLAYREISELMELPIGTIMSRLSRGKDLLRQRLAAGSRETAEKILPLRKSQPQPTTTMQL